MFNALKYTEELERAGFSHEQADASVKILIEVMNESFATKSDLKEIEFKLDSLAAAARSGIKELEFKLDSTASRLESTVRETEYKLTIKLGTLLGTLTTIAIGVTATLVKVLAH